MRILITNCNLSTRTGTETYVRDLAVGLHEAGQEVAVYSPLLGSIAAEIAAAGIPVVSSLRRLSLRPDVIHGHNYMDTARALLRFPRVPAIFVCHRWRGLLNLPPRLSGIRRYVAVDHSCRGYLLEQEWIPRERICMIHNPRRHAPFPASISPSAAAGTRPHLQQLPKARNPSRTGAGSLQPPGNPG